MLALDGPALAGVAASLAVGTPALTCLGAIGAALTVSLRRGGLLLAVLVIPLTIPVLIFGVSAAAAASGGTVPFGVPLLVLCGLSVLSLAGAPFAAAAALRLTASDDRRAQAALQRSAAYDPAAIRVKTIAHSSSDLNRCTFSPTPRISCGCRAASCHGWRGWPC